MSYTVESISSKEVNTKFGMKPTYSFKAGGEWYKCGFKNPRVAVGDVVEFTFTEGAYGKDVNMDTLKKAGGGAPSTSTPPARPATGGGYGSGKGVFPIPPLDGQRSIVRQNSLTNAVNLLKDKPTKSLTVEEQADLCISIARKFEAYSCGDIDLASAKEKAASKAAKSLPEGNPFEEAAE